MIGGAAAGTAFTSSIAGESIAIVAASSSTTYVGAGWIAGSTTAVVSTATAPAVAPAIALTAATAAAAYATLKAWCARHDIATTTTSWYQSSVDSTSQGIEFSIDAHGKAVGYTSRVFEGVGSARESASGKVTDWLCRVTGNC